MPSAVIKVSSADELLRKSRWSMHSFNSICNVWGSIPQCACRVSHNAPRWNRSMHISVPKWCIVGYGTAALRDSWYKFIIWSMFQRKSQRRSPVAVFMSALAVADSLVLILDFVNNWLKYGPRIYLLGDEAFCRFHRYFFNVAYTLSSWLVSSSWHAVWWPLPGL